MKLALTYTVGDGCTYSCDVIKLFEYESEEALLCDFMDAVSATKLTSEQDNNNSGEFLFCGENWRWSDFYYWDMQKQLLVEQPPTVETFESYFEREGLWKGKT